MWLALLRSCFRRPRSSRGRNETLSRATATDSGPPHGAPVDAAAPSRCPVCDGAARLLDRVDFNKSCEEPRGNVLPHSGVLVDYHLCERCGFCYAPQFRDWDQAQFEERIYNDEYVHVDPDYLDARPRANAGALTSLLGDHGKAVRHLDYGGGTGLLSRLLQDANWQSASYDPFSDSDLALEKLGRYDLITAFEVFEHVPDVQGLMSNLASLLERPGLILFSTLLSDGHVGPDESLDWWYAAPRNGHVSLFSRQSLAVLGSAHGFSFGSLSDNFHAYWKEIPAWAQCIRRDP